MEQTAEAPLNYFNYFTEIEDTFIRRRNKNLLLSPLDWAIIEGWRERGIPLHIVIRAIESVFDAQERKPSLRAIKGLVYCREEVEAQYEEWSAAQTGKSEEPFANVAGFEAKQLEGHIDSAVRGLQDVNAPSLAEDIDRACERLGQLRENLSDDLESVDRSLCDIESFLDNALLTRTDKEELSRIMKEVSAPLKPYRSSMAADAYKRTVELLVLKHLRDDLQIPRLGLFYL